MSQSIEIYEKELEQEFGSGSQREMYLLAIIRALKAEENVTRLKNEVLIEQSTVAELLRQKGNLMQKVRDLSETGYPLVTHLVRQIAFSQKAFGPGLRTGGILDHIAKELKEVAEKPHDLSEWIDVAMLALDGAWRHATRDGVSDEEIAQQVVDTLQAKLAKNEKRDWPDWRLLGEDKAIEHKRDQKAGAA